MNCTTNGCKNKVLCKGLCTKCYYRVKRGGTAEISLKQQQALRRCEIQGCEKPHHAKGMCGAHWMMARRKESPEQRKKDIEFNKKWREKNPAAFARHQALYRERHGKRLSEYYKKWRDENRETFTAYQKARKSRVKKAMPKWASIKEIEKFYFNCPKGFHVDHIIPLNGKSVCGLHTVENLQYLLAIDNLRKSNKT